MVNLECLLAAQAVFIYPIYAKSLHGQMLKIIIKIINWILSLQFRDIVPTRHCEIPLPRPAPRS